MGLGGLALIGLSLWMIRDLGLVNRRTIQTAFDEKSGISLAEQFERTGLMQGRASASLPVYFPVSITKFLVMHFCTLGGYQFYWFYENWKIIRERERTAISPFWRTFFAFIFCYPLFEAIRDSAPSLKMPQLASPHVLATVWVLLSMLWILPDPYWLASFLSIGLLVPIQQMANWTNQSLAPNADRNDRFTAWNTVAIVIGGPLFIIGVIAAFLPRA